MYIGCPGTINFVLEMLILLVDRLEYVSFSFPLVFRRECCIPGFWYAGNDCAARRLYGVRSRSGRGCRIRLRGR